MKLGIMTYKEINPSHFGSNPVDTQINLDLNLGSILVEVSVMRLALAVVHCLRVHLVVVVTSDKGGGKCVCAHYDQRYTSLSCQMRHNKFLFTSLQYKKKWKYPSNLPAIQWTKESLSAESFAQKDCDVCLRRRLVITGRLDARSPSDNKQ